MNKKEFVELIDNYKKFNDIIDKLYEDFKITLVETELFNYPCTLFEYIVKSNFTEEGSEWIDWWLYEHSSGCEAYDEENNIIPMNTADDLWEYVKKWVK